MAAVAAAATPVVAAALLAVGLAATACRALPAPERPPTAGSPLLPQPSSTAATAAPTTTRPGAAGPRLLLVLGAPAAPRVLVLDPDRPDDAGTPLDMPAPLRHGGLAAVVSAPDGRLAAVGSDGSAWLAPALPNGRAVASEWQPLAAAPAGRALPGPVLGAAWSDDGTALVLMAGAPGSGARRTVITTLSVDGAHADSVEVPLEADGPAIAALPRGVVAFVGRDRRDRGALARIMPSGSFASLPVAARGIVAGGGLVALVDDTAVRVGTLEQLDRGVIPTEPLPLAGPGGIGSVAIAPDGSVVAVVRLDDTGAPARLDLARRATRGWTGGPSLPLVAGAGTAAVGWLP